MNKFALVFLFVFGVGFAADVVTMTGDVVLEHGPHGCGCGKGKGGTDKGDGK